MNNDRKNTTIALITVLVLAVIIYAVWAGVRSRTAKIGEADGGGVICTMDAMQCPDGSWVGRSGPKCQFVCPLGTSTPSTSKQALLQATIGSTASGLNVQILPLEIAEDSRCPFDVQCIQAGTVRVRVLLTNGLGESTTIFTLDKPVTTKTETVTLIAVTPTKESTKTIDAKDYRFTFRVTKR